MKTTDLITNTLLLLVLVTFITVVIQVFVSWVITSKTRKKTYNSEDNMLLSSYLVYNAQIPKEQFRVFSLIVFMCLDAYDVPFPNVLLKEATKRGKIFDMPLLY